jgi:hypothetical protein
MTMMDETFDTLGELAEEVVDTALDTSQLVAETAGEIVSSAATGISTAGRGATRRPILAPLIGVTVVAIILTLWLRSRRDERSNEAPSRES